MSLNLAALAQNGRAFDARRAWTEEENIAVYLLVKERAQSRLQAAEYVRNGILTLEAFDKAKAIGLSPINLEEVKDKAVAELQAENAAKLTSETPKKSATKKK